MARQNIKICFSGGGTGGSVTPLLAIYEHLLRVKKTSSEDCFWLGSRAGLEKRLVENLHMPFKAIASGKLRRYFSFSNFIDPVFIVIGFIQALTYLLRKRPDVVITAGSFVAVPVAVAGWLLRIPVIVHQMDVRAGLANKLMAPFAEVITTTFAESLTDYGAKARLVGNPVRTEIKNVLSFNPALIKNKMKLALDVPVLLVVGGGTGAEGINELIVAARTELEKFCQIIHQTGASKGSGEGSAHYRRFDFLDADFLADIYCVADLVVSRAGLGFITEFSFLEKPAIVIPMPRSHQEDNANLLKDREAAVVLDQAELSPQVFIKVVKNLLLNKQARAELGSNIGQIMPKESEKTFTSIIEELVRK